jgi:hypothetical protein
VWEVTKGRYRCACFACGTMGAAHLGISRRGWPFMSCTVCKTRAFLNSPEALTTLRLTDPSVITRLESDFARATAQSPTNHDAVVGGDVVAVAR